jgi:GR25 family glycosyltransferase involved in LPS biosynthesis
MPAKAFIIHLERATARRQQAIALAGSLPIPAELLPAVDGKALSQDACDSVAQRHLLEPRYPFALGRAEIGCFLSHRRAWQAIVDGGHEAGLVAEDDVEAAASDFAEVVAATLTAIKPDEFVRLPMHERGEKGGVIRISGPVRFVEPRLPGLNMQMQIIGREAARRLLAASGRFDRPVDSFVQMQWVHGARVLTTRPVVIREIGHLLGGSVIQNKKMGFFEKVSHEVQRPLHRLLVQSWNEQWRRKSA